MLLIHVLKSILSLFLSQQDFRKMYKALKGNEDFQQFKLDERYRIDSQHCIYSHTVCIGNHMI